MISPYNPTKRETYRGPDAGKVFLERIQAEEKEILKKMDDECIKPMHMTDVDQQTFNNSDTSVMNYFWRRIDQSISERRESQGPLPLYRSIHGSST